MPDFVEVMPEKDLIGSEVDQFKQKIVNTLSNKPEKLLLNLSKVKVIDSSGIGTLIAAKNSAVGIGCDIVIRGVSADIMKMFKIMRLTDHFVFEG